MKKWEDVRSELDLSLEDESIISLEIELLETIAKIRKEQGLSQADLAKKCNVKQSAIARIEKNVHSPQVNSLLKILTPLGYKLQIVPIK